MKINALPILLDLLLNKDKLQCFIYGTLYVHSSAKTIRNIMYTNYCNLNYIKINLLSLNLITIKHLVQQNYQVIKPL